MARSPLIAVAVAIAFSGSALAHEWGYCLAPSFKDHKLYVSTPVPAHGPLGTADRAYARILNRDGLHYSDIQCPMAKGRRTIAHMRRHALNVNRELGMAIVPLPLEASAQVRSVSVSSWNN